MLKRLLLLFVAVPGCALVLMSGTASAHQIQVARTASCAAGNRVANYCETACVVPHVEGLSLDAARRALLKAHCTVGKITFTYRKHREGSGLNRIVTKQNPHTGSKWHVGYPVNLVVLENH